MLLEFRRVLFRSKGVAAAVAKKAELDAAFASDLEDGCGYAGAAHAPLMLAAAIEQARPGDRLLVVGFGQGVDVLVLEVGHAARPAEQRGVAGALAEGLATDSYLRMLRSEEHTSELQSLMRISYAVFCLKKKKTT